MEDGDEHDEEVRHAILYSKEAIKDGAMLAEHMSESAASVVTRMPVDVLQDPEKVEVWKKDYDDMLENVLHHGARFGRASVAELAYNDAFPSNATHFENRSMYYDKHGYRPAPGFDGGMFYDALPKLPGAYAATDDERVGPAGMPDQHFHPSRRCCTYVNGLEEDVVGFSLAHGRLDHVDLAVGTSVEMHAMSEEQRQFADLLLGGDDAATGDGEEAKAKRELLGEDLVDACKLEVAVSVFPPQILREADVFQHGDSTAHTQVLRVLELASKSYRERSVGERCVGGAWLLQSAVQSSILKLRKEQSEKGDEMTETRLKVILDALMQIGVLAPQQVDERQHSVSRRIARSFLYCKVNNELRVYLEHLESILNSACETGLCF